MHFTLSDYILDILHNALEAGSQATGLGLAEGQESVRADNVDAGRGMSPEELAICRDPFFTDGKKHPGRSVGLGPSFLAHLIAQTGGKWSIESAKGIGTRVSFEIDPGNIDAPPIGDPAELFGACLAFDDTYELEIARKRIGTDGESKLLYELRRSDLVDARGEIESVSSRKLMRSDIAFREGKDGKDDLG